LEIELKMEMLLPHLQKVDSLEVEWVLVQGAVEPVSGLVN
jgi:hypothetical protein